MMASSLPPMVASQLAQLPFPGAQVERDQLIGLGNADDFRDARQVFKTPAVDWTLVAGDTNGCSRGTGHQMRTQPNFLNHVLQLHRFHAQRPRVSLPVRKITRVAGESSQSRLCTPKPFMSGIDTSITATSGE